MKYILLMSIAYLVSLFEVQAQEESLLNYKWEIYQYEATFLSGKTNLYHKDSLNNPLDLSETEFEFIDDGTYTTKVKDVQGEGEWSINSAGDSIIIDGRRLHLFELNEESFVFRSYTLEYADTAANLDTVYMYTKLKPIPGSGKVTSVKDRSVEKSISVYPNPSDDKVTVQLMAATLRESKVYYRLLNTKGKEIEREYIPRGQRSFDITIAPLPKGIYLLEVLNQQGKRLAVEKILKE